MKSAIAWAMLLVAPDPPTSAEIATGDALADVRFLAAPDMEGRGALTPGLTRAAVYIASRFRAAGLSGAGDGGSFFQMVDIPVTSDLKARPPRAPVSSRNVVAFLPGSDPSLRDEAVLIGAHYDHLGRGNEGSSLDGPGPIHPGADDNASGTAALLEIAEAFAAAQVRPKRSILFVAFTGEEKGLLGSRAMATRAPRTLVAMINLDMVGRMKNNALEVGGSSTSPGWEDLVTRANTERLVLSMPRLVQGGSDHAPFLDKNVPALFLFTGLHGDYHRASDTPDKINADGVAKAARLAFRIVRAVADRNQHLAFVTPEWIK